MNVEVDPVTFLACLLAAISGTYAAFYLLNRFHVPRTTHLKAICKKLGLRYSPKIDLDTPVRYREVNELGLGTGYAKNVIRGKDGRNKITIFDYSFHLESDGIERESAVYICRLRAEYPKVRIVPETNCSRFMDSFSGKDIDFESSEFSDRFSVCSEDRAFAYALCSPSMIEFLLQQPDVSVEVSGKALATIYPGHLDPATLEENLQRLLAIRDLIPTHLLR